MTKSSHSHSYLILSVIGIVLVGIFFLIKNDQAMDLVSLKATEPRPTPHPVSLIALADKTFAGSDFTVGKVLEITDAYTRYFITYKSDGLTISGIMNVPKGPSPIGGFPVLILNHGHIDIDVYTNGRGLRREQDYFARRGYAVVHPDYRNHAQSDKDPENSSFNFRFAYTIDVINAVNAIRASKLHYLNGQRIGMLGHSMGGGITENILVAKPDLIKAAVLYAPVSADATENFQKWVASDSMEIAREMIDRYGHPSVSHDFWANVSPQNFLDNISVPIMLHHGTEDKSVPIEWSNNFHENVQKAGKEIYYHVYRGEGHEFGRQWDLFMENSLKFFDRNVKGI